LGQESIIGLNTKMTREKLNLLKFGNEERAILILTIIVLKSCNNLILELGPFGVLKFLEDVIKDLFEDNKSLRSKQIADIFMKFKDTHLDPTQKHKTSPKIDKLLEILDPTLERQPKTIVFVKDRSVAEYLHKILRDIAPKLKQDYAMGY